MTQEPSDQEVGTRHSVSVGRGRRGWNADCGAGMVPMTHQVLLDRIPGVPDVQAAGLLLLHNAQATANTVANDCVSQLAG